MTGRVRTAALFTLLAGATLVAGQNPPSQAQTPPPAQPPAPNQGPTFRVRVDYVEVDVVVNDRQGNLRPGSHPRSRKSLPRGGDFPDPTPRPGSLARCRSDRRAAAFVEQQHLGRSTGDLPARDPDLAG